jgi:hypothetical protein
MANRAETANGPKNQAAGTFNALKAIATSAAATGTRTDGKESFIE